MASPTAFARPVPGWRAWLSRGRASSPLMVSLWCMPRAVLRACSCSIQRRLDALASPQAEETSDDALPARICPRLLGLLHAGIARADQTPAILIGMQASGATGRRLRPRWHQGLRRRGAQTQTLKNPAAGRANPGRTAPLRRTVGPLACSAQTDRLPDGAHARRVSTLNKLLWLCRATN